MSAPVYRTDYPADCQTHAVDGLQLIYHRPSGATHFLSSPVPEILSILADEPCDGARLTQRLCDRIGAPVDDEAEAVIAARIADLLDSGLIRTA